MGLPPRAENDDQQTGGDMNETDTNNASAVPTLTALAAVAVLAGAVWAAPQQPAEQNFAWKDGAEVYTKICALCHETAVGPALRGRGLDPLYIGLIVRNGSRAMPAFRAAEIDDQSLKQLAEYVSKAGADK
jgi:4-cresol dehydrogenase (hydroxylating) cytochrome subunit